MNVHRTLSYFHSAPGASIAILLVMTLLTSTAASIATTGEHAFLAENSVAMEKMMAGMSIKPTGDIDRDFTGMMIPHHQGAIDMAVAELRYGKNEQLRRIAQEIIVSQQQEIAAMHLAIGQPLSGSAAAQTQISVGDRQQESHQHH